MKCCKKSDTDDDDRYGQTGGETDRDKDMKFTWHLYIKNLKENPYVRHLEEQHKSLMSAYININTELANLYANLRYIVKADPSCHKQLIDNLGDKLFNNLDSKCGCPARILPTLQHDSEMGDIRKRQCCFFSNIRQRVGCFQKATENLIADSRELDLEKHKELIQKSSNVSEATLKRSNTKMRKAGGSESHLLKEAAISNENSTRSEQSFISVRSTSFKEVKDMLQKKFAMNTSIESL